MIRRGFTRVRQLILIVGFLLGTVALIAISVTVSHDPVTSAAWSLIGIVALAIVAPVLWSLPTLLAPTGRVATVTGIMGLPLFAVAGYSLSIAFVPGFAHLLFAQPALDGALGLIVGVFGLLLIGKIEPIPEPT